MKAMSSAERLRAALRRQPVDRVPVAPDISMMMPARYTGRPFWDVFFNETPPLWQAIIDLTGRFGFDHLQGWGGTIEGDAPGVTKETAVLSRTDEAWQVLETTHTPEGDLTLIKRYARGQSPWTEKPLLADPDQEVDALLSTLPDPASFRLAPWYPAAESALGDRGLTCAVLSVPLAWWMYQRVDLQAGLYDFYDRTALVERALAAYGEWALHMVEAICRLQQPGLLMFGGSVSSMSVVSPDLYRRYAYPWLKKACQIAAGHGVPTAVHMCGKCRAALDMVVDAGVTMIEPLERPPSGDITLAEARQRYGAHVVLKGNVNTFETLAWGTPEQVRAEARQCIADAGEIGFILYSGDQVPGNTPEANFRALIDAVRTAGA